MAGGEGVMAAFRKFDLSLIPSAATEEPVAQVAQIAQEERSCATFATCAGHDPAAEHRPAERSTAYTSIPEPGPGAEVQLWHDWYEERCAIREYEGGYARDMAEAVAYREARNRWHLLHGQKPDLARCAGCGELLSGRETLALPDGARVHVDDEWFCLRICGKRWRAEAVKGLADIGIMPPDDLGNP